jgi:hypothetical protein
MTTKTVVCPSCGSPAEPGRFACGACGALLAAVAAERRAVYVPPNDDRPAPGGVAPDDVVDARLEVGPALEDELESEELATPVAAVSWPPPDDRGPALFPPIRTPAGAYLPPSAVLPPLDAPSAADVARSPVPNLLALGARMRLELPSRTALVESLRLPAAATRTAVGTGAAIASISFLLPWINGLPGAGLSGYLDRWGLAGPGLWIVFVVAAAVAAIALGSERSSTWPVGLPSVVLGGVVLGLVWSSVFGPRAAIGVWFALAGAIVLVAAGALDLRSDHDPRKPVV